MNPDNPNFRTKEDWEKRYHTLVAENKEQRKVIEAQKNEIGKLLEHYNELLSARAEIRQRKAINKELDKDLHNAETLVSDLLDEKHQLVKGLETATWYAGKSTIPKATFKKLRALLIKAQEKV